MTADQPFARADLSRSGFHLRPSDRATFAAEARHHQSLIQRGLPSGQPAVVGGPQTTRKMSAAIDSSRRLSGAALFSKRSLLLGWVRLALLSGGSATATAEVRARGTCQATRVRPGACAVRWDPGGLTRLNGGDDRKRRRQAPAAVEAEKVIIDPLSRCVLEEPAHVLEQPPRGEPVAASGRPLLPGPGVTPVLLHHATDGPGWQLSGVVPEPGYFGLRRHQQGRPSVPVTRPAPLAACRPGPCLDDHRRRRGAHLVAEKELTL